MPIQNPIKEKKVLLATDEMFLNSRAMVVEYHDVLRAHWFSLFYMIATGTLMEGIFDIRMFQGMGAGELFEWYIFRKHRNFFYDLVPIRPFDSKETQDKFYQYLLEDTGHIDALYAFPTHLNAETILHRLVGGTPHLVKHIYIYEGLTHEPLIQNQLHERYGNRANFDYIWGDFKTAIEGIDKDCTYFLSDIEKISVLEEMDRVRFASILIPDGFRYNYKEEDQSKLKVDIDKLKSTYMCRCALFDNFPTDSQT